MTAMVTQILESNTPGRGRINLNIEPIELGCAVGPRRLRTLDDGPTRRKITISSEHRPPGMYVMARIRWRWTWVVRNPSAENCDRRRFTSLWWSERISTTVRPPHRWRVDLSVGVRDTGVGFQPGRRGAAVSKSYRACTLVAAGSYFCRAPALAWYIVRRS